MGSCLAIHQQFAIALCRVSLTLLLLCCSRKTIAGIDSKVHGHKFLTLEGERRELLSSGMCPVAENETVSNLIASCKTDGGGSHRPPSFAILPKTRCYCDSLCKLYGDCCIDASRNILEDNMEGDYFCRDISQNVSPVHIYLMQRCPPNYSSDRVRILCEQEAGDLFKDNEYYSYIQEIPVHSSRTGIMYRNVYCAMCNDDVQLTKWKTHFHCLALKRGGSSAAFDDINFSKSSTYNPVNNQWTIQTEDEKQVCKLIVEELATSDMLSRYGARLCLTSVSSCIKGSDVIVARKCRTYSSYVYEVHKRTVYKNFHCAVCNRIPPENILCFKNLLKDTSFSPHKHTGKAWLPLLFDFNFDEESGSHVGATGTCRLKDGQIWDPLLKSCLNVSCGRLYKEEHGKCVPIAGEYIGVDSLIQSDCRKVILSSDYFFITSNGSIYSNYTERFYNKGEYEVHEKKDGKILTILICERDEKIFVFDAVQSWLSELSLSVSIVCLVLHLTTYGLLSKLRNRPGKILMSLSSSLICGHFFFLIGSCLRRFFWICYLNSILTYFGYVSAFLWMNVMAVDIFKTFCSSQTRTNGDRRFVKYSLYSWISASVITIVACSTDFIFADSRFRPKFGKDMCWFNNKRGLLIFFALPAAVLLMINFVLFLITAFNIRKMAKQAKMVSKFSEKMRFILYIKLAIVLGLTWVFGFLAASLKIKALWYPFIILNGLQGALIFIVFTIKRKILHMLVVKLKVHSDKYKLGKTNLARKGFYTSLSTLTTLQTSLTSSAVPAACGSPQLLTAVRRLNTCDPSSIL